MAVKRVRPSGTDLQRLDRVLKSVADGTRRRILEILAEEPGVRVQDLVARFDTSRFAIMKHVNILEAAALVRRERDGVSKRLYLDLEPLDEVTAWLRNLSGAAP